MSQEPKPRIAATLNGEDYLNDRVQDQIDWYNGKAGKAKKKYLTLRVVGVVVALTIPILSGNLDKENTDELKVVIAIAGAVVALCEALLTLYKFRDTWTNYRNASEALIQHKFLFVTKSAPYNTADPLPAFVQNAESIMSGERVMWLKQNTAPEGQLVPDKNGNVNNSNNNGAAGGEDGRRRAGWRTGRGAARGRRCPCSCTRATAGATATGAWGRAGS